MTMPHPQNGEPIEGAPATLLETHTTTCHTKMSTKHHHIRAQTDRHTHNASTHREMLMLGVSQHGLDGAAFPRWQAADLQKAHRSGHTDACKRSGWVVGAGPPLTHACTARPWGKVWNIGVGGRALLGEGVDTVQRWRLERSHLTHEAIGWVLEHGV